MKIFYKYILLLLIFFLGFNCTEEIPLETQDFEDVLVVEATITNELKFQEVKLSRTYLLESNTQTLENNADVSVIDNLGNSYSFTQNSDGLYVSDIEFEAMPNTEYTLLITTNNGVSYSSSKTPLAPSADLENIYPEVTNDPTYGQRVTVFVDSNGELNNVKYFRYEFEDTYKVVAPYFMYIKLIIDNVRYGDGVEEEIGLHYDTEVVVRDDDDDVSTCFTSNESSEIIIAETSDLEQNSIIKFPIKTIDIDDIALIHRYSILVKQYTQSVESYTFYKVLKQLGSLESVLSANQPGYVTGNMAATNSNRKVIGYFDVSSFTSSRIYFNYADVNIARPLYFVECNILSFDYSDNLGVAQDGDINERVQLYNLLTENNFQLISKIVSTHKIVRPECGDCTTFSSKTKPDFWED